MGRGAAPLPPECTLKVYQSALDAKHHRVGVLNHRNLFSHNLEGESPRSRCWQVQFLLRPLFLSYWGHCLPVSSHGLSSVCVCVLSASSHWDTSQIGSGPTRMTLFYLNYLFKSPIYKYRHILKSWGLGLQHVNLVGSVHNPVDSLLPAGPSTFLWSPRSSDNHLFMILR